MQRLLRGSRAEKNGRCTDVAEPGWRVVPLSWWRSGDQPWAGSHWEITEVESCTTDDGTETLKLLCFFYIYIYLQSLDILKYITGLFRSSFFKMSAMHYWIEEWNEMDHFYIYIFINPCFLVLFTLNVRNVSVCLCFTLQSHVAFYQCTFSLSRWLLAETI